MKSLRKSLVAFFTALTGLPALADEDHRHYEENRKQYISYQNAADIAIKTVGSGQVVEVEFDRDWNGDHFDVEIIANDGREYDVVIDARSGKVLSKKFDG